MSNRRIVIYPKDIMQITGKSERYSRYLLKKMKLHYQKQDHQLISVTEFSDYLGLKPEEVYAVIQ